MNILEVEDQIKGLPDQMLIQEASQPSGRLPQFLVVSELQRRNDMRKAAQKPPTRTVAENVVQEGIASLMPQPPMQAQMQPSPQGQMPMQAPMAPQQRTSPAQPMMMASGGVTKMQDGGMSPFGTGFEGQGVPNIIDMIYAQQMQAAQAQREAAEAARQQAATRSEQMQEQARRDALSQALVGIGTGIARGDMAGGFAAGAESAQGRMKEARTEAMRASERAEQIALAREEAARTGELGAFTRGAELRLGMQKPADKSYQSATLYNRETDEILRGRFDPDTGATTLEDGSPVPEGFAKVPISISANDPATLGKGVNKDLLNRVVATENFVDLSGEMMNLLQEEGGVNTLTGRAASTVNNIKANIEEVLRQSGQDFEPDIFDPEKYSDTFERLGVSNERARGLLTALAVANADAMGLGSGKALSEADVKRSFQSIGGDAADPKTIALILNDAANRAARATSRRINLARRQGVEFVYDGDFGLSGLPTYRALEDEADVAADVSMPSDEDIVSILGSNIPSVEGLTPLQIIQAMSPEEKSMLLRELAPE